MCFGITQTPQVFLDHQLFQFDGELVVNWDFVEAVFEPATIDAMVAAHRNLLESLRFPTERVGCGSCGFASG